MIYKDAKKLSWLEVFTILLFSSYCILPSLPNVINFLIVLAGALMYSVYVGLKDKQMLRFVIIYLTCSLLIATAVTVLTDTTSINVTLSYLKLRQFKSTLSQYLFMYLPVVFSKRVFLRANLNQKKLIFTYCSSLFVFVTLITLKELAINPGIIRQWENFSELEHQNVGDYYFVYAIPILITTLAVLMENKKIDEKIFILCFIALFFFFILQAEYTLALLITMIGLLVVLYKSIKNMIFKMIFIFASIFILILLPNILSLIADNIHSTQMALRITELQEFFSSGSADGHNLNGRLNLYWKSILAFLKSPIFGNRTLGFNGHALFLTILADTGLLGGIPFYCLLVVSRKQIKQLLKENNIKYMPVFLCLLLTGFTNPIQRSYPVSFAIWFLAPLAISLFTSKEDIFYENGMED